MIEVFLSSETVGGAECRALQTVSAECRALHTPNKFEQVLQLQLAFARQACLGSGVSWVARTTCISIHLNVFTWLLQLFHCFQYSVVLFVVGSLVFGLWFQCQTPLGSNPITSYCSHSLVFGLWCGEFGIIFFNSVTFSICCKFL